MQSFIESRREEIAALCRQFHVRRLDVFGSATAAGDFDQARSDVDVLIDYLPDYGTPSLAEFLALRASLQRLFGRPVDLVVDSAVRNPFVRAGIDRSRKPVYGA